VLRKNIIYTSAENFEQKILTESASYCIEMQYDALSMLKMLFFLPKTMLFLENPLIFGHFLFNFVPITSRLGIGTWF
jgi:hypothetical protein